MPLLDALDRPLKTLRVSVTDRCNFRCPYCMPKEKFGAGFPFLDRTEILSFEEITERRFGHWTMGQVDVSTVNPSLLLKYAERPVLNPFDCSGQASLALLDELLATAVVTGRGG